MTAAITPRPLLLFACAAVTGIGALAMAFLRPAPAPERMLLAPMIGLMEPCIMREAAGERQVAWPQVERCSGPEGSAAALVDATLDSLVPAGTRQRYELGYTLNVPLLQLFEPAGGGWQIDLDRVDRLVRTVRDTQRPVVLYLFSNHFATGAPIEEALAGDPANLGVTPRGPLARGSYYGSTIHHWSFADPGTALTARRIEAARAFVDGICRLGSAHIQKIRAVTLLGEVHHLFPGFESGMGFTTEYQVTDYGAASKEGFRRYVQTRFKTIAAFNRAMGTEWTAFEQVEPPSKDVRRERLRHLTEHIDSFAHGMLPIAGWLHAGNAGVEPPPRISVYRNGELIGRAAPTLDRQDVLEALPELGTASTGWRFDLDFRDLPTGLHRLDVYLEQGARPLVHLATRQVAIMDAQQTTPLPQPQRPLPASIPPSPALRFHLDLPADLSSYFHNPLVAHWHAYRSQQVVDYLQFFNRAVGQGCLAPVPRYTHQIVPFSNPGWDANKFAIDASLEPLADLRLGVSLYGEASYGESFAGWLRSRPRQPYAVTEFHPLRPLGPAQLRQVLDRHAQQGAQFLSFFLEPRVGGERVPRNHNIFSLDPQNTRFGSAVLYRSMAASLAQDAAPVAPVPGPAQAFDGPAMPVGNR